MSWFNRKPKPPKPHNLTVSVVHGPSGIPMDQYHQEIDRITDQLLSAEMGTLMICPVVTYIKGSGDRWDKIHAKSAVGGMYEWTNSASLACAIMDHPWSLS